MSEFQYFNSPHTTFNVLKDNPGSPIFDNAANTATYEGYFEVENKTGQTEENVTVVLPYIWAVAPPPPEGSPPGTPAPLGNPGPVALDFDSVEGDWNVKDFNGIKGLDLEV